MLLVVFYIDRERYALDSSQVVEIVPVVRFRELPGAPDYIRGVLRFRGHNVPVVDVSALAGKGQARRRLSTRVILVEFLDGEGRARILGLLAERVTETIKIEPEQIESSGIRIDQSPYLGDLIQDESMTQLIRPGDLLPEPVRNLLFPREAKNA